jgi:hypothetical protein
MNGIKALERAARAAHRDGIGWNDFWVTVAEQVRTVAPYDRDAYRRLVERLLHLLTTGEASGQEPAGDVMPWTVDDEAGKPADVGTQARRLWPMQEDVRG